MVILNTNLRYYEKQLDLNEFDCHLEQQISLHSTFNTIISFTHFKQPHFVSLFIFP